MKYCLLGGGYFLHFNILSILLTLCCRISHTEGAKAVQSFPPTRYDKLSKSAFSAI